MKVLTSLNPNPGKTALQSACMATWRAAGLDPVSFNHPSEMEALRTSFKNVEFVPTENTSFKVFGRHFVCVNALLDYTADQREPTVITNADLHLRATPTQFAKLAQLAADGMPYLLQWNVDADMGRPQAEPCGISAFVVQPRFAGMFEASFLSLGQPWWDYWLPFAFVQMGIPLFGAGADMAYHIRHDRGGGWSSDNWCTCARELDRMFGLMGEDKSQEACSKMSAAVYAAIEQHTKQVRV
jgi:hypothetical protein